MVCAMRPFGEAVLFPREFLHTSADLSKLTESLRLIDGSTRVIREATGRYHEPVLSAFRDADVFISVVNPKLIKDYGNNRNRMKCLAVRFLRRFSPVLWAKNSEHFEMTRPIKPIP